MNIRNTSKSRTAREEAMERLLMIPLAWKNIPAGKFLLYPSFHNGIAPFGDTSAMPSIYLYPNTDRRYATEGLTIEWFLSNFPLTIPKELVISKRYNRPHPDWLFTPVALIRRRIIVFPRTRDEFLENITKVRLEGGI